MQEAKKIQLNTLDGVQIAAKLYSHGSSKLNLIVAGSKEALVMVEAGADDISESQMVEALDFGHQAIKKLVNLQEELYQEIQPVKSSPKPKEIGFEQSTSKRPR